MPSPMNGGGPLREDFTIVAHAALFSKITVTRCRDYFGKHVGKAVWRRKSQRKTIAGFGASSPPRLPEAGITGGGIVAQTLS